MSAVTTAPVRPARGAKTDRRRAIRPVDWPTVATTVVAVVCGVVLVWPVLALAVGAFHDTAPGNNAHWGFGAVQRAFDNPHFGTAIGNTVLFTVIVVPLSVAVGLTLALVGTASNARLRRLIGPTIVLAYAMPPMFYAIGYALAGSGRAGLVNDLVHAVAGLDPVLNATSWPGLLFVSVLRAGAYCYILLAGPVRALSRSQDEAARASGATLVDRLWSTVLPSLRPALGGAFILAIVSHIGLFDAIYILGNSSGITTLSVLSYRLLQTEGQPDFSAASVTGLLILLLAIALIVVQQRRLDARTTVTVSGKPEIPLAIEFGRVGRTIIDAIIIVYVFVFLVVPVGSIVVTSLQRFPGVYSGLSLRFYEKLFADSDALRALATTFGLGVLAGAFGVGLSIAIVAVRLNRPHGRLTSFIAASAMAPVALSGIIGALGYIWAVVLIPQTRGLYGSYWLLLLALAAGVVPASVMLLTGSMSQIDPGLLAAARASGDSWLRAFTTIVLPLMAPALVNTWFLSFISVVGALDLTLILGGPELKPASTFIYRAYANAGFGQATAMLMILLLSMVILRVALHILMWVVRSDLRPRWLRTALHRAPADPDGPSPTSPDHQGVSR